MNDSLISLGVEVTLSLAVSTFVVVTLIKPLKSNLTDLCGSENRAAYWAAFNNLVLHMAPLICVVVFSHGGVFQPYNIGGFIRHTLQNVLLGEFIGMVVISLFLHNHIRKSIKRGEDPVPTEIYNTQEEGSS